MPLIEVKNLRKTYMTYKRGSGFKETLKSFFKREKVEVKAVDDISFEINEGDIAGILGPNGAGKSTTIKMLCGALFPTSGKIDVMGFNPSKDRKTYVNKIGAVFGQKSQLIWDIPPIDSFRMNKAIYGIPEEEYKTRLDRLATLFEVTEIMEKPTRVLSLGERMKCEFIMAMLHNPKIVFLDEPTIGLDVIAKTKIREFIREMNREGVTFILTTHDLEDVEALVNRVIVINHGQKVFDNDFRSLRLALGDKKIVHLVLSKPLGELGIDGAEIIDRPSELEVVIEVNAEKIAMNDFMEKLSAKATFTDISIKELPMDKIITSIYGK